MSKNFSQRFAAHLRLCIRHVPQGCSYSFPPLKRKPAVRKSELRAVAVCVSIRKPPLACNKLATHELHHWHITVHLGVVLARQVGSLRPQERGEHNSGRSFESSAIYRKGNWPTSPKQRHLQFQPIHLFAAVLFLFSSSPMSLRAPGVAPHAGQWYGTSAVLGPRREPQIPRIAKCHRNNVAQVTGTPCGATRVMFCK